MSKKLTQYLYDKCLDDRLELVSRHDTTHIKTLLYLSLVGGRQPIAYRPGGYYSIANIDFSFKFKNKLNVRL